MNDNTQPNPDIELLASKIYNLCTRFELLVEWLGRRGTLHPREVTTLSTGINQKRFTQAKENQPNGR